jgi:hypothetical protein
VPQLPYGRVLAAGDPAQANFNPRWHKKIIIDGAPEALRYRFSATTRARF